MKITFDGRALCGNLTGIGYFTKNLVLPLSKHFEISLCAHKNFYIPKDFKGKILIGPETLGSLWFHIFFPRLVEDDILFCPLNAKPYKTKKKSITIIQDLTPFLFPKWHKLKIRITTLPFLEETILNSCIITLSNKIKREIQNYFQKKNVFVIPPGCNVFNRETKWEREKLEDEFFLYLGTIEPRKNLEFLIEFWKEKKNLPNLYIAGDKGWKVKLKKIPNNVKIIGYVSEEEKYFLLRKCLALIYPSSYEGFGLPLLEAGLEGTPIISTKVPATEEYKIKSLILINLNFKSLKKAIEVVLKGKIRKEKSYILSWEEVALKYKEVIDWYIKS